MPAERLLVGDCIVDIPVREVHAPGERRPRRITPKSLGVLLVLVGNAGRVVSRDTLMAEVWPDSLPTDDVITQAVTQLRKAFAEEAGNPRYIETIAKSGYRLLAPVRWLTDEQEESSSGNEAPSADPGDAEPGDDRGATPPYAPGLVAGVEIPSPATGGKPAGKSSWLSGSTAVVILALGLLGLLAVAGFLLLRGAPTEAVQAPASYSALSPERPYRLITSTPGFEVSPALSPDGSWVAYSASQTGRHGTVIMVQTTDLARPRQLTQPGPDVSDRSPAWGPDGRQIAFLRVGPGLKCQIMVVPANGGAERVVGQCDARELLAFSWTPDGRGLVFGSMGTPEGRLGLRVLDLASGRWRALAYPSTTNDLDYLPRYSPDGKWIVFVRNPQLGGFWRIPAAGGAAEPLSPHVAEIWGWDWMPGGQELLFGRRVGSESRLFRLEVATGVVRDFGLGDAQSPAVSQRARKLAFVRRQPQFRIYRFELEPRAAAATGHTVFESSGRDTSPSVSPDGTQLVFNSDRSGRHTLWWAKLGDPDSLRAVEGLVPDTGRLAEWNWDSSRLMVVGSDEQGRAGVYEVRAISGQASRLPVPVAEPVQALYLDRPGRVLIGSRVADAGIRLILYDRTVSPWRELASLDNVSHAKVDPARGRVLFTRLSENGLWEADESLSVQSVRQIDTELPRRWRYRSWDIARDGSILYLDQTRDCLALIRWIGDGEARPSRCVNDDKLAAAGGFSVSTRANAILVPLASQDGADIGFMGLPESVRSNLGIL